MDREIQQLINALSQDCMRIAKQDPENLKASIIYALNQVHLFHVKNTPTKPQAKYDD